LPETLAKNLRLSSTFWHSNASIAKTYRFAKSRIDSGPVSSARSAFEIYRPIKAQCSLAVSQVGCRRRQRLIRCSQCNLGRSASRCGARDRSAKPRRSRSSTRLNHLYAGI